MKHHDKATCPYCSLLMLAGQGLKESIPRFIPDKAEQEQALMRVAAFLGPAIDVVSERCEAFRELTQEKRTLN